MIVTTPHIDPWTNSAFAPLPESVVEALRTVNAIDMPSRHQYEEALSKFVGALSPELREQLPTAISRHVWINGSSHSPTQMTVRYVQTLPIVEAQAYKALARRRRRKDKPTFRCYDGPGAWPVRCRRYHVGSIDTCCGYEEMHSITREHSVTTNSDNAIASGSGCRVAHLRL